MPRPEPVTLTGRVVRLEPLALHHHADLLLVALDPSLWQWTWSVVQNADDLDLYIKTALLEQDAGRSLPFAIIDQKSGKAIGSTRYGNIEPAHKRLEIGWTWLGRESQRTGANTETKLLLLTHAFEVLGMNRVEFKTDALNDPSRAALLRIGAKEEGVFRRHGVAAGGRIRDTAWYSIIADEWPATRQRLEARAR